MKGKVVVATGATSGIGANAVEAMARLEAIAPGLGHQAHLADLSLMRETKRVGAEIAASEPRVDVLVNNAGATFADRRVTPEVLERTFALNHMSYFILTLELLDSLKAAPAGRIVSTASDAHRGAVLAFGDLQAAKSYSGFRAYQRSKLANILFTRELAHRLEGERVTANCLHPGVVASRFGDEAGGWVAPVFRSVKWFAISPEQGADTLVYLASSPEVASVSGEYFAKRKVAPTSAAARDMAAAKRLWDVSEELMGRA